MYNDEKELSLMSHCVRVGSEYTYLATVSPFMKYNPFRRKEMQEIEHSIDLIREYARKIIVERMLEIKNNEYVPDDILNMFISIFT